MRVAQAEVAAQGGAVVFGAEAAAFLQQRDDRVDEVVEAARGEVRDEDEAVAGVGLDVEVDLVRDLLRRSDELLACGDLDDGGLVTGQMTG